mgnify:CR=1 FL=1
MLKKLISYHLIATILLGTIGISIFTHTCHLFNVTESTIYQAKACCGDFEDKNQIIDVNCCSLEVDHYKLSVETLHDK